MNAVDLNMTYFTLSSCRMDVGDFSLGVLALPLASASASSLPLSLHYFKTRY